ncbi:MAG TPA: hypothetical protein EYQ67_02450 [Dehalococcoidia bacterium]|nr:hypothetical protein [Dehalococcoidia bacterium]
MATATPPAGAGAGAGAAAGSGAGASAATGAGAGAAAGSGAGASVRQRGQVRELGPGQVPLSALPEVRWTQPYTVFFLLSACLADYVRGSVASGQRYPQKSCHTSRFRRLGRS